jgi:hypothetical protein
MLFHNVSPELDNAKRLKDLENSRPAENVKITNAKTRRNRKRSKSALDRKPNACVLRTDPFRDRWPTLVITEYSIRSPFPHEGEKILKNKYMVRSRPG